MPQDTSQSHKNSDDEASLLAQLVESACNVGDSGSIPGSGGYPGAGNGNPLQYSCLGNPMEGRLVGYSPWGHKSWA